MKIIKTNRITEVILLSLTTATLLQATNGDNLIGTGAKSRGMGGTSIAVSHGAESGLHNPSLITTIEGTEIGFGGTLFMPEIKSGFTGASSYTSDADTNMIPEISIAHKINENWYIGVGMWGTAGMGTDYSNSSGNNFSMLTNLQLMQFGLPIAYKTGGFSVGITPILQYGNLDIQYDMSAIGGGEVGAGLAQDFGLGYNLGISYYFSNFTIGAIYKSAIEMSYKDQLTTATTPFGISIPDGNTLEQPAEIGIGFAYKISQHRLAFDYKQIKWSDAKGYSDFGWKDQDIYAFGYEYSANNWAVRVGYNYADSAVISNINPMLNILNLLGFPATSETHYTLGGTYEFSKQFSVDLAYVYSPETSETFSGMPLSINTTHLEKSLSFQLNYKF